MRFRFALYQRVAELSKTQTRGKFVFFYLKHF